MVSMLSSYIVRIYAWKAILGPSGVINLVLISVGAIDEPLSFLLYGNFAIVVTLVHILIPLATLPIYAALQNVDRQVLEASRDLGAGAALHPAQRADPARHARPRRGLPGVLRARFGGLRDAATRRRPGRRDDRPGDCGPVRILRQCAARRGARDHPARGLLGRVRAARGNRLRGAADTAGGGTGCSAAWGRRGKERWAETLRRVPWLYLGLGAILVFLYTPLVIVVVVSFNTSTAGIFPLKGLTLDWYAKLLGDAVFHDAIEASLDRRPLHRGDHPRDRGARRVRDRAASLRAAPHPVRDDGGTSGPARHRHRRLAALRARSARAPHRNRVGHRRACALLPALPGTGAAGEAAGLRSTGGGGRAATSDPRRPGCCAR